MELYELETFKGVEKAVPSYKNADAWFAARLDAYRTQNFSKTLFLFEQAAQQGPIQLRPDT